MSFHALSAKTAAGADLDFSSLKGRVVLVTNVASR
jgi:glutathione peroxidase-family protein